MAQGKDFPLRDGKERAGEKGHSELDAQTGFIHHFSLFFFLFRSVGYGGGKAEQEGRRGQRRSQQWWVTKGWHLFSKEHACNYCRGNSCHQTAWDSVLFIELSRVSSKSSAGEYGYTLTCSHPASLCCRGGETQPGTHRMVGCVRVFLLICLPKSWQALKASLKNKKKRK